MKKGDDSKSIRNWMIMGALVGGVGAHVFAWYHPEDPRMVGLTSDQRIWLGFAATAPPMQVWSHTVQEDAIVGVVDPSSGEKKNGTSTCKLVKGEEVWDLGTLQTGEEVLRVRVMNVKPPVGENADLCSSADLLKDHVDVAKG